MTDWSELEVCRWQPAEGEPAPRPLHFDERYVLPVHGDNLPLQVRHEHERDVRISFSEGPHLYTVDGNIVSQSISSLAHDFEEPFDTMVGINAMKNSRREAWPRKSYVINPCKVTADSLDPGKGCLLHDTKDDKTVSSIPPDDSRKMTYSDIMAILETTATNGRNRTTWVLYNFDREETKEEIEKKWRAHGEDARNRGTEAHLQMELWFNSLPARLDDPEVVVGLNFIKSSLVPLGAKAFKTEWEIHGQEEDVAGSIDLAVILPSGDLYLIDWKRSEKLKSKMTGFKSMKEPLNNLEDCSGCSYALQLSSYQYIIEKYYGYKVRGRALVSLHPTAPFTTTVPYLKKEVEYIMLRRRLYNSTRLRLQNDPAFGHLLCCKTGRLAENAVEDEEHNIYWKKTTDFYDMKNVVPCEWAAKEVEKVLKLYTPIAPPPEGTRSWRSMFPSPNANLESNMS